MKNRTKFIAENRNDHKKVDNNNKVDKHLTNGFICLCCIFISMCNYYHISHMQEKHVMFSHLSTMEREMSFRTEMGFYYSFFKQVIEAPSLMSSIHRLTSDNLTEYPLTINALHRFNVYPELTVGFMYRAYNWLCHYYGIENRVCYTVNREKLPPVNSCEGLGEPSIFYVNAVMLLNGAMLPFLFLISVHISGGSIVGGIMSTLFYFYNHRECTRVQWTPPLRESFSYPLLLAQQFFLLKLFYHRRPSKMYEVAKYGYLVTTLLALLSWQFAQFSLLTQCIAVFLAYVVAGDNSSKGATTRILILLLMADLINVVLQFGNTLLLVGPLRPCIVMALLLVSLEPSSFRSRFHNSPWAPVRWLILTIALLSSTFFLKYFVGFILQIKSDDHMFDILKSKFSNFRSFDSLLYTCAPEFDFYSMSSLLELTYSGLLPVSISAISVIVIYSLAKWYQLCRGQQGPHDDRNFLVRSGFCDIGTYFLLFQTFAYTIMAALIMRLKLFWTPQLCIVASLMCHGSLPVPGIRRLGRWWSVASVVLVLALCSVTGLTNLRAEWSISGSYSNWDQEQLLGAIVQTTSPGDSFAGQMATMATVRLVTGRPVTMHPHYEDEALRHRVHVSYSVYSRRPLGLVWLQIRSVLHASYLVYEAAYCGPRTHSPGCSYLEMWDLVDGGHSGDGGHGGHEALCALFNEYIADVRLGRRRGPSANDVGRYFRWKFTTDSGMYTLFEVVPVPLW